MTQKSLLGDVQESVYEFLERLKFFAYSGEDGDLYRKYRLGGWRISVYWGSSVKIQRKGEKWRGNQYWNTVREYTFPDDKKRLEQDLAELIKNKNLEEEITEKDDYEGMRG